MVYLAQEEHFFASAVANDVYEAAIHTELKAILEALQGEDDEEDEVGLIGSGSETRSSLTSFFVKLGIFFSITLPHVKHGITQLGLIVKVTFFFCGVDPNAVPSLSTHRKSAGVLASM